MTIDQVRRWEEPSKLIETAALEGVMLTSSKDMVKIWPKICPNERAADRTLADGVPVLPGFVSVSYRPAGASGRRGGGAVRWRQGFFDLSIIPDPKTWLEGWLGAGLAVKIG